MALLQSREAVESPMEASTAMWIQDLCSSAVKGEGASEAPAEGAAFGDWRETECSSRCSWTPVMVFPPAEEQPL